MGTHLEIYHYHLVIVHYRFLFKNNTLPVGDRRKGTSKLLVHWHKPGISEMQVFHKS